MPYITLSRAKLMENMPSGLFHSFLHLGRISLFLAATPRGIYCSGSRWEGGGVCAADAYSRSKERSCQRALDQALEKG